MVFFQRIMAFSGGNIWEKLLLWYENSVLKELMDYLNEAVFRIDFGTYQNFSVSSTMGGTLKNVILGLMLGMVLAAGLMLYTRTVQGRFVRTLLKHECFTPDRALTLRETGMFRNVSVRRELAEGGALSKLTRCVEEEAFDPQSSKTPFQPDFQTAHFYIPEDLKYRAEVRYDRKGSGLPQFLLTLVLCIAVAVLLCRYLPVLLGFADWIISLLAP